jgi:hypothetical protein
LGYTTTEIQPIETAHDNQNAEDQALCEPSRPAAHEGPLTARSAENDRQSSQGAEHAERSVDQLRGPLDPWYPDVPAMSHAFRADCLAQPNEQRNGGD